MTIFCPKCGAANEEIAEFCASCGEVITSVRDKKAQAEQPETTSAPSDSSSTGQKKLYRSRTTKIVSGLSAGLADYLSMDVEIVRILWIVIILVTGSTAAVIYIILWAVTPLEPETGQPQEPELKPESS